MHFIVHDLGRMSYEKALQIQEARFNEILDHKRKNQEHALNTLFLVEHDPVYTLGKSGDISNLKRKPEEVGAAFFKTNRGGDITYHGPGQIVGYPVFDLEQAGIGIAEYIWRIEEAIIVFLNHYGVKSGRIDAASGVWLDPEHDDFARKICAIGVKASRYVTMHGFAFNANTDLSFFNHIVPCGIDDKGVTSLEKERGTPIDLNIAKNLIVKSLQDLFE
jgi:lipoyl(octanoyl) transferase